MAQPSPAESPSAARRAARVALVLVGAAACCPAQRRFWVDYPPEVSSGLNGGSANLIAVGTSPNSRNFDESRWQQLVPAFCLPPVAGRIEAIAMFNYFAASELTYESLQIDVATTKADRLLPGLAENLRAPLAVLDGRKRTISWLAQEPTRIGFDRAFPYAGSGGLVVDFIKRLDPETVQPSAQVSTRTAGNKDGKLPKSYVSFGARGSESCANDAKTREYVDPIVLRLEFTTTATLGARWRPGAEGQAIDVACVGDPKSRMVVGVHAGRPARDAARSAAVVVVQECGFGRAEIALPCNTALLGMPVWVSAIGNEPGAAATKALLVR